MTDIQEKIHGMANDKQAANFTLTQADVVALEYQLSELQKWRETGFSRLRGEDVLNDGLTYLRTRFDVAERNGKAFAAVNVNRLKSFIVSMDAIQDAIRYSMLNGVSVKERKDFCIYFPVAVTPIGSLGGENFADMGYDQRIIDSLAKAQEGFDERGLWAFFPGESALYLKIQSAFIGAERTDADGVRGFVRVVLNKSITGYDVATVIRFVAKQMKDWFAAKVRGFEFQDDADERTLAVDLSDAFNVGNYQVPSFMDNSTDYSVMKKIFSRVSDEHFVTNDKGHPVRQYMVTETCAEIDGAPGDVVTFTDTVNKESMSFAFNMNGELV